MNVLLRHIHSERVVGVKLLSDADLGRSPMSNQTHIGLSIKALTFLRNGEIVDDAFFFYGRSCKSLCCNFDMILRENGRIDAPKIRKGYVGDSVVEEIRQKCLDEPGYDWYLIWFGLNTGQLVFWLIREESEEHASMSRFLGSKMKTYDSLNPQFSQVLDGIEHYLSKLPAWELITNKR